MPIFAARRFSCRRRRGATNRRRRPGTLTLSARLQRVALAGRPDMPTDLPSLRSAKLNGEFARRLSRPIADAEMRSWVEQMTAADPAERLAAVKRRNWN